MFLFMKKIAMGILLLCVAVVFLGCYHFYVVKLFKTCDTCSVLPTSPSGYRVTVSQFY